MYKYDGFGLRKHVDVSTINTVSIFWVNVGNSSGAPYADFTMANEQDVANHFS
jgi:hypothetical protein